MSLSGSPAFKEDEGFYTVCVPAASGHQEQTNYMFVKGELKPIGYFQIQYLNFT